MTLEEAKDLAQKQADEFGVVMIVVKDDLSEDPGGFECCAMYRTTLYPDHHKEFWDIVGRCEPQGMTSQSNERCQKEMEEAAS